MGYVCPIHQVWCSRFLVYSSMALAWNLLSSGLLSICYKKMKLNVPGTPSVWYTNHCYSCVFLVVGRHSSYCPFCLWLLSRKSSYLSRKKKGSRRYLDTCLVPEEDFLAPLLHYSEVAPLLSYPALRAPGRSTC